MGAGVTYSITGAGVASASAGVVAGITCSITGIGAESEAGRGMGRGRRRCNVYHWRRRNITDTEEQERPQSALQSPQEEVPEGPP